MSKRNTRIARRASATALYCVLCWAVAGSLTGCSALVASADAAITVVAEGVSVTAKAVGSAANAIIP